ncbi:MAG: zinc ABC transporter solute-binding protein, partial [Tissierellia bacterium]|nr:zinc ABC transporter solute-binding protein [Tissierellia bacterium]
MKYISLILLIIIVLTGCQAPTTQESDGKITIMATLFPQYDFARIVGGDQVTVTLILPPGVEAHAYEPTPKEVGAIQKADLFLYTGEQMEPWAHRL